VPERLPIIVETNRMIRAFAEDDPSPHVRWQFICECGCYELVELTIAEFDAADAVLAPGHRLPDVTTQQTQ